MKKKKFPALTICILLTVTILFSFFIFRIHLSLTYTPGIYNETADALQNPYRGFYHIYGYMLSDDGALPDSISETLETEAASDTRLIMLQINLKNFRDTSLSDSALTQLDQILMAFCKTDKHLILRFLYDWNGDDTAAEPGERSAIENHMQQTAEVCNHYAERIYLLQGLFTGYYGEMHHSLYQSAEDMTALTQTLADAFDPLIFLAVRTPQQWRAITGISDPSGIPDNSQSTLAGRLGLYNDGMLGSETDTGTYGEGMRESELHFQTQLCETVPNGGEVIIDNPFNDAKAAISDLSDMHVSYLNENYDMAVLEKWKRTAYEGTDVFTGYSAYDYIAAHLGYRYVFRASNIQFHTFRDQTAQLQLTIENTGFSNSGRPFTLTFTLVNRETGHSVLLTHEADSRILKSGQTTILSVPLDVRNYEEGTYALYFSASDPTSGEQIAFANDLPLTQHGYQIGTLSLHQ